MTDSVDAERAEATDTPDPVEGPDATETPEPVEGPDATESVEGSVGAESAEPTPGDGSSADTTDEENETDDRPTDHLQDVGDGCGCAEIWEHLSDEE